MIKNVIEYLENAARIYPDKIAFADGEISLTFSQVLEKAKRIAQHIIRQCGYIYNQPIAVYMEKSVHTLCAFLGIVYSGNYYCPIDRHSPKERCLKILSTLRPVCIVYQENSCSVLDESLTSVFVKEAYEEAGSLIYVENIRHQILDCDPLYVLFTSGSTGTPKGVVISHKSVIDYTEWLSETFSFNSDTVFGNQAPFIFDNSILDIYSTLKNGSTMNIIPESYFAFPKRLFEYMQVSAINTIFWVPSALVQVANSGILSQIHLSSLQKIMFCGEVMPNKQLNIWRKHYPNALYANLYGPTEITDVCTYYIVDRDFSDEESLPIGKPCQNTQILVLDENDHLVTDHTKFGELCVRGTCVSLGYYADIKKTQAAFTQNPLHSNYRDIIYRTGDLVRYDEDGNLLYLGRKDFQIKHQGHRIELGEIETAVGAIEQVQQNCVLYDEVNKIIHLFVCAEEGCHEKDIYLKLKNSVPKYMLPGKIHLISNLPKTSNGKIDRVYLKEEYINNAN